MTSHGKTQLVLCLFASALIVFYITNPEYLGKPRKEVSMITELRESPKANLTTSMSPVGDRKGGVTAQLTFYEAVHEAAHGKKVSKKEWNDPAFHIVMHNELLMLHKPDDKLYHWIISAGDIAGIDWYVLEE